jgi:hypothetical protein
MARDPQDFLRRWSRRKQEAAAQPKAGAPQKDEPAPALPPLDSLTFESDFKAFMHAKVKESVKRAALKKLFADPRFNVMDGLDIYIDDYSKDDPLPPGMLERLAHARAALFGPEKEKKPEEAPKTTEVAQAPAEPQTGQPQKKADDGAAG